MFGDGALNAIHATITDIYSVSVEYLAEFWWRQMAVDMIKKCASNIGFDTFTKRWVEPYDISLAIIDWLRGIYIYIYIYILSADYLLAQNYFFDERTWRT